MHEELCTPECANPWDVVRYLLAGERILADLAAALRGRNGIAEAAFYRCNVDYAGAGTTWGAHESVLHQTDPRTLPSQLLPFLVSRIIITGAGGFDPIGPWRFTLSPRAAHLQQTVSSESTHDRGIFHTKDEPLAARGFHRLHILCGESLSSVRANWLKAATTVLVVAMTEAGLRPGDAVALREPVQALQCFAADPTCRATTMARRGAHPTALEIQRHYLQLAEKHVDAAWMPAWGRDAILHWRDILDRLERGPEAVETTLDWAIKLRLFQRHAQKSGIPWEALPLWDQVLATVAVLPPEARQRLRAVGPQLFLEGRDPAADALRRLDLYVRESGLRWEDMPTAQRVRLELFELDTRFGELGPGGIFNMLDAQGVLDHAISGVDNIEHALTNPPATGRARVRGEVVRRLAGQRHVVCDWTAITDLAQKRTMDLTDPWIGEERWTAGAIPPEVDGLQMPHLRRILAGVRNAMG